MATPPTRSTSRKVPYPSALSSAGVREDQATGPRVASALKTLVPENDRTKVAAQFLLWHDSHGKHMNIRDIRKLVTRSEGAANQVPVGESQTGMTKAMDILLNLGDNGRPIIAQIHALITQDSKEELDEQLKNMFFAWVQENQLTMAQCYQVAAYVFLERMSRLETSKVESDEMSKQAGLALELGQVTPSNSAAILNNQKKERIRRIAEQVRYVDIDQGRELIKEATELLEETGREKMRGHMAIALTAQACKPDVPDEEARSLLVQALSYLTAQCLEQNHSTSANRLTMARYLLERAERRSTPAAESSYLYDTAIELFRTPIKNPNFITAQLSESYGKRSAETTNPESQFYAQLASLQAHNRLFNPFITSQY